MSEKKFCRGCGTAMDEEDTHCSRCGVEYRDEEEASDVPNQHMSGDDDLCEYPRCC